jgi:CRP/FNR family transcriptional regulator, dissimilatory nitrate respiration regulator
MNAIESTLAKTELFKEASETLRKKIASAGKIMTCEKGDFLFSEGEPGHSLYAVTSGFVKLVKNSFDGKEVLVRIVNPGELFGEVVLFESDRYPVTAIAGETTELWSLRRDELLHLLDDRDFRSGFCAMLMRRMRYLAERVLYISAFDVEERFFRFLAEQFGKKYEYDITLSKRDIASAIGTIPETLSRLLMRLKQRGVIIWEGNRLTVEAGFWDRMDFD